MGVVDTLIGWAVGVLTALVGLWVYRHTVKRDAFQDHCSSYKERIAIREKEFERATEGPDKENKKARLNELCDEYDQFLEAWQQKQELAALVPRRLVGADEPKRTPEEAAKVGELLAGSARLPPTLLTADDYLTRGNAYYDAHEYEQALEAYNRALELRPDDPDTLVNRGDTLDRLKRYEEALKDYNRTLELRPDDPRTLHNRALTLADMGRYEDALKDYNRALELRPDHYDTLIDRGVALGKLKRYEDALKDCNRALELRPDIPEALSLRGAALACMGQHEDALKDCNRALELEPGDPIPTYIRACVYSFMGRFEEALRDLEAAIKVDQKLREEARTDEDNDFENLRNDPQYGPRFRALVGEDGEAMPQP